MSLRPLDWAVLLVLAYEAPSLVLSRYPANGLRAAMTIFVGALLYFLVRLAARTARQIILMAALPGAGGVALACFALSQFREHVHVLQTYGFADIVAFRAGLIAPPAWWIPGELMPTTIPNRRPM
jgi:hypothetical protein